MGVKSTAKKMNSKPELQHAVIYARYSSHNQREESIEQQVEECMLFAKSNGFNVVEVYADKAISGRTDRRNNFQRMMRDAEKGKFQVVIAYKSNRIARNMLNALQYEAKLDAFGVKTLYAKEEFGDTAAGRFALRTMMNVNQFYSENMSEDIRRGMRDNAESCKVNGMLPLGYVRGKDGQYEICEAEAEIVRDIFEKVLNGVPMTEIANELNARGIKTKRGNLWNKGSFHRMLVNENYIGTYKHSGVVIKDGIPAIVDKEVFSRMQVYLKTKKKAQGKHREMGEYLLTGKLYCGYCGAYMTGISGTSKTGAIHYYYTCQTRRNEHSCDKENVQRDYIERKIAELTKEVVLTDDVIEWIADNAVSFQLQARRTSDIVNMENELADNKKAQKNIMAAIEQGIFTATTKDRLLEIEANISNLERRLNVSKAMSEPIEKERIIFMLEKFKAGDIESKEYQKRLIDTFVKSVYLWDDKIRIDYYYAGKNNSKTVLLDSIPCEDDSVEGSFKLSYAPPQGSQTNSETIIFLTIDGFSLVCPLNHNQ